MLIIGIDPGLSATGWGVVNATNRNDLALIDFGTITTSKTMELNERLYFIFDQLVTISRSYNIVESSIENVFVNSNPKSSMFLCYARSAAILAMMSLNIKVFEYSPTKIKKCLTSSGSADKEQVLFMVKTSLKIDSSVSLCGHASDSLASALCHIYSRNSYT